MNFDFFILFSNRILKMNTQSNVVDLINAMISDPITDNCQSKTHEQPSTSDTRQQSPEPKRQKRKQKDSLEKKPENKKTKKTSPKKDKITKDNFL